MWWCHHIRAEVISRQLGCHKQLYLMWIWFILLLGLWSPVTSALVRIQVADVLISSVTVPQGQRYDSQRSHSDSTNHVCVGMYQSMCLLCRVGRGGCTTFLILISHSSNHHWWRMSIPGTQEEGAGRDREKGREWEWKGGIRSGFPLFRLVVHNHPEAVACQNRKCAHRDLMQSPCHHRSRSWHSGE